MPRPELIKFSTPDVMTRHLVQLITMTIEASIARHGCAHLALSGGSSPRRLYEQISHESLPWENVRITLVDERWILPDHSGSNERFIHQTILQNKAAKAQFTGLYSSLCKFSEAASHVEGELAMFFERPFDVVIMGMGGDGHTASWFPGARNLAEILESERHVATSIVPRTDVTGEHTHRITLTPKALRNARLVCLPLVGKDKKSCYEDASKKGPAAEFPVRTLLDQIPDIWPCWAA